MSDSLQPHESQHARPPCPSPTPGVLSDSRTSSQWCHPAISFPVVPFSSCPQSLPASESLLMSQLFTSGGQSTGVSALASFLPKNAQDWSPLEWTGWISLQSKGLSRVLSNTTVQKYQFFGTHLSSQSNSHIHTGLYKKNIKVSPSVSCLPLERWVCWCRDIWIIANLTNFTRRKGHVSWVIHTGNNTSFRAALASIHNMSLVVGSCQALHFLTSHHRDFGRMVK